MNLSKLILIPVLAAVAPSIARAGSPVEMPLEAEVFDGKAWTSATYSKDGLVESVSLFLSMDSIRNAPTDLMKQFRIPLPKEVQEQTFFNHVGLDWNPHGHPPLDVYTRPHFDFHFYSPPSDVVLAIDCKAITDIATDHLPTGYVLPPIDDPEGCVPAMGVHAVPVSDLQPNFEFTETMIYGYYGEDLTFLEPMVTQDFLLGMNEVTHSIQLPSYLLPAEKLLPTSYSLIYDADQDAYEVRFEGFTR